MSSGRPIERTRTYVRFRGQDGRWRRGLVTHRQRRSDGWWASVEWFSGPGRSAHRDTVHELDVWVETNQDRDRDWLDPLDVSPDDAWPRGEGVWTDEDGQYGKP